MPKHKHKSSRKPPLGTIGHFHVRRRIVVQAILLGLLSYAVLAGLAGLSSSLAALRSADTGLLVIAAAAIAASYGCATLTYLAISYKPLSITATAITQLATGLTSRLLPAGLGGAGINVLFLHRQGYSLPAAAAVAALNNLLGLVGNVLLLAAALLAAPAAVPQLALPRLPWWLVSGVLLVVVCAGLIVWRWHGIGILRRPLVSVAAAARAALASLRFAARRPGYLLFGLISSMVLTGLHASGLYLVTAALGISITPALALLAVSVGTAAGALLPTPGGLGGAEAGIASVLLAAGVPAASAVPAALLYRGLTYWLPLLPGYVALRLGEKRGLYYTPSSA